ncbi:hypothetical protein D0865_11353 [Hortaea werneckii]|uniref:Zn(2)-C6 fungal-type domain-containing protein n=1 Tax=Hortaea werneckii TaxID=91943 RepID=A0A3M7BUL5_HORWE|nr:hypothetical protein D0865_11353 [Hortaea werneckii]
MEPSPSTASATASAADSNAVRHGFEAPGDLRPPPSKRVRSSAEKRNSHQASDAENFAAATTEQHDRQGSESDILKRFGEPLDYPRRRATIACEICRSRKSRCDGARPKCRLCTELGAECNYREPGIKLDAGDKLILEQLARIEGMLHTSLSSGPSLGGPISPATSNTASEDYQAKRLSSIGATGAGTLPLNGLGTWSANISTMPKTHTTPALHLLQWPVIKDLVSRPCDPQVLLQREMAREPLDLRQYQALDFSNLNAYAQAFFERVNVWYAIVNPYTWWQYYRTAASQNLQSGAESCAVLLVLALGEAAHSGVSISLLPSGQRPPGMSFFAAAWTMLPSLMNTVPLKQKELLERVYWNTLLIESDLLAELDLPHSGIVQFEEIMRLPRSFPYDVTIAGPDEELPGDDDLWYFLAEIALRRLLNRVSHLIYTHKRSATFSIASLEPVVAELDYQLTQWYEGLPISVKFPRERTPAASQVQTVLRLRYFACRTIIYRPYIQAVLSDPTLAHDLSVQESCQKCLEACLRQLETLSEHHEGHLPYLWQGALSLMSQSLLLMGATLNPALKQLLPSDLQMTAIFAEVVAELGRLVHLAPSLDLCAQIVKEAEEKRRLLSSNSEQGNVI